MVNFTPRFRKDDSKQDQLKHEKVTDYMTTKLITFTPDEEIHNVIETIIENKISGAPVVNEKQELIGIISEKDCLRVILDDGYHNLPPHQGKVTDFMSTEVKTFDSEMDVVDAANEFLNSNFRRFPVVKNGKMVGLVSRRDILRAAKKLKRTTW